MREVHLALEGQTNKPKPLISIYLDYQNARLSPHQAKLLLDFANVKGRLGCKKVYYNSQSKDQASVKGELASLGFNCLDVPCLIKNSADNQLIADCIEDVENKLSPDIIILVSGDGDFAKLVNILHELGKKVIIFAQPGNVKQSLKELADEFHFVDELPGLIVGKTQQPTTSVQSQITYKDARECLIEAIKTALSQDKHTEFGLIDNLMRQSQRFPNYQGVSSIHKHDGKTFSRFSKFIDAVVADGKVRVRTVGKFQQLFLVE